MTAQLERPLDTESPAPPAPGASSARTGELVLVVLGVVAAVLAAIDVAGPVRTVVVFVALLLVPGWAMVRRVHPLEPAVRFVLTVIGSIGVLTILALAMVWSQFWHPRVVSIVVLVVAAALIAWRPRAAAQTPSGQVDQDPAPRALTRPGRTGLRSLAPVAVGLWIVLGIAVALWISGLATTNSTDLGQLGLLPAFPVFWYLSVAIAFVVIVVALFTRARATGLLAGSLGTLIVILYASANLVENAPRLPWVYKHIAVTNYIYAHGSVNPAIDLYNRWPGFFSFSAAIGSAIGVPDAADYASWAEVLFALIDGAIVLAIARTIMPHRRFAWTAVVVFTVGNWVGQNYYSPQGFAFMLYLTAVLIALRALGGGEPRRLMRWIEGLLAKPAQRLGRSVNTEVLPVAATRRARGVAIAAILVLQLVVTASHQLTPYVMILALIPLFVLGYLRPLWVAAVVVVLPVLYLLPNLNYVKQHFGLFSSFDPVANASTASVSAVGVSEAATLQSHGVVLLTGLAVLLALVGFVRRILQGHIRTTLVVAWLAFAPVFTFFGQSYGGEGKFRVFLFGLPFYAIGVSWLFWSGKPGKRLRGRLGATSLVAALTVMLALFVGTYFQPEGALRISRADVNASLWLDSHFRDSDQLFALDDTFPSLIGPNYAAQTLRYQQSSTLTGVKSIDPRKFTPAVLDKVIDSHYDGGTTWVSFSDNQERSAVLSGEFTKTQITTLEGLVARDGTLVYDADGSRIYEIVGR